MFIDLGMRVALNDDQFQEEMTRRVKANPGKDVVLGCPLCGVVARQQSSKPTENQNPR